MFLQPFTRLLEAHCPPGLMRATLADPAAAEPLRAALDQSGFLDILLPESAGGGALPLPGFAPLVFACGAHVLPVDYPEAAVGRLLGAGAATLPPEAMAAIAAGRMAGAMQQILSMTIAHLQLREQFGRPLGRFQALQQQVAVMAEETAAAALAAQIGFAGPTFVLSRSAVALLRCSEAAASVSAGAHQLHGAIGATHDHDLHLYTGALRRWQQRAGTTGHWAETLARHRLAARPADSATYIRVHLQPAPQNGDAA